MVVNNTGVDEPLEARLYEVIRYVRPLHQYLGKAVADALEGREVTVPVRAVLERLADAGPQTVPQVGRSLWITRQFVQRLMDDAAERGLVEPAPNPAHKRSPLFRLTDRGRAEIRDILAREAATLREVAEGLDPQDVDACVCVLAHVLSEFRDRVRAHDGSTGWDAEGPRPGEDVR
ncbi:MarR family winged helix-turn-helix transcriptional regulator [Kineosporia sp. A_224]|uniref:MarR family winged helix-turn-helix transcriptional regulator n=1 Tax=Kineosporia sp. A_224 TaxID=1962180 RepID=UPI000B4BFC87|nr:MarR family winged helix-turn-helix transcriptional regulator [Kineosporia sp. A_224]